jgi:hypothetical protein
MSGHFESKAVSDVMSFSPRLNGHFPWYFFLSPEVKRKRFAYSSSRSHLIVFRNADRNSSGIFPGDPSSQSIDSTVGWSTAAVTTRLFAIKRGRMKIVNLILRSSLPLK